MAKKDSSISRILAKMTVIPLFLLSIVTIVFGYYQISTSLSKEVMNELSCISGSTLSFIDTLYPGDYNMYTSEKEMLVTKGDIIMNSNYKLIDNIKAKTDVDFTLFYGDVRIITTICDSSSRRIIGTKANSQIVSDVQNNKTSAFYENVNILSKKYYCYYEPLFNQDGSCIGMFATVMPAKRVRLLTAKATIPFVVLIILALILANYWSSRYASSFKKLTGKLEKSLDETAKGKLSNTVPPDLLSRNDEFGHMAHSIIDMQASLRTLVEQDMLTGLSNRRFGQERLDKMATKAKENNEHFSIALGDIDFFKKFNDTYGHDCGDMVLRETSQLIQHKVKDYGFCARWGGEEFLIVFTHGSYNTHKHIMEELISEIAGNKLSYISENLSVTMTFGLLDVFQNYKVDDILKQVDDLLYEGKENGRNRLVTITK